MPTPPKEKMRDIKLRRGQKCHSCKKEIKKEWCYNGFWWHAKCKDKDTEKNINSYLKTI